MERKESVLPPDRSGDWHTRFHHLKFGPAVKSSQIVDVGVTITKEVDWSAEDSIKSGALHIHDGILADEEIAIADDAQIDSQDFDGCTF